MNNLFRFRLVGSVISVVLFVVNFIYWIDAVTDLSLSLHFLAFIVLSSSSAYFLSRVIYTYSTGKDN